MRKATRRQSTISPSGVSRQIYGQSPATRRVLILNAGSSSLKFAVFTGFDRKTKLDRMFSGNIDRIGSAAPVFTLKSANDRLSTATVISAPDHLSGLAHLLQCLAELGVTDFAAVGHRVVHGGTHYCKPQRVNRAMLTELRRIQIFDPEHLPAEIALMEFFAKKNPRCQQIACFDTAFHHGMPRVAKLLAIPRRYQARGVQRYGFHGLSYACLMQELKTLAGPAATRRVILAHLGNGASMAAVRGGQGIDTTMAFTPAAGLVMGTRSGDLDPGLMAFLARNEKLTAARFDKMTSHESGLLGISETSADMRDLLAREKRDVRAAEAVALFTYTAKKQIGAYAAALGGVDTLVFAGGIGENSPVVRARICAGLDFLGLKLDQTRNRKNAAVISARSSVITVRVIHTDEELMIAQAVGQNLNL